MLLKIVLRYNIDIGKRSRSIPPQPLLIPSQRPIPRLLMIHTHPRIPLHPHPPPPWVMNRLPLHLPQLRHPFPNILPALIKFLTLQNRVENPEIWLRIHARAGTETPTAVIGGKVPIDEMLHEVALAHAPVDEEVFGEERGDAHAGAVVHVACMVELAHGGVDEGVAGLALGPFGEEVVIVFPFYVRVFRLEGFVHARGGELVGCLVDGVIREGITTRMASVQAHACRSLAKQALISIL